MTEAIHSLLEAVPGWLHVLIISMVPIIELRGALPYGILLLHMSFLQAIPLCLIGNLIPAPFILLLAGKVLAWMSRSKIGWIKKFGDFIKNHSMKRSEKIEKYTFWGLVLFVGIPLPGTGVWTGSVIASLLNLKFSRSLLAMFLGEVMACAIVSALIQAGLMIAQ